MLQHTVYKQSGPILVNDMDLVNLDHYSGPVWVIQYSTVYKSLSGTMIVFLGTYSFIP